MPTVHYVSRSFLAQVGVSDPPRTANQIKSQLRRDRDYFRFQSQTDDESDAVNNAGIRHETEGKSLSTSTETCARSCEGGSPTGVFGTAEKSCSGSEGDYLSKNTNDVVDGVVSGYDSAEALSEITTAPTSSLETASMSLRKRKAPALDSDFIWNNERMTESICRDQSLPKCSKTPQTCMECRRAKKGCVKTSPNSACERCASTAGLVCCFAALGAVDRNNGITKRTEKPEQTATKSKRPKSEAATSMKVGTTKSPIADVCTTVRNEKPEQPTTKSKRPKAESSTSLIKYKRKSRIVGVYPTGSRGWKIEVGYQGKKCCMSFATEEQAAFANKIVRGILQTTKKLQLSPEEIGANMQLAKDGALEALSRLEGTAPLELVPGLKGGSCTDNSSINDALLDIEILKDETDCNRPQLLPGCSQPEEDFGAWLTYRKRRWRQQLCKMSANNLVCGIRKEAPTRDNSGGVLSPMPNTVLVSVPSTPLKNQGSAPSASVSKAVPASKVEQVAIEVNSPASALTETGGVKGKTTIRELEAYINLWLSRPENAGNLMPSLTQKERIIQETGIEKKRLEGWFFRARKKLKKQQESLDNPQISQPSSVASASTVSGTNAGSLTSDTAPATHHQQLLKKPTTGFTISPMTASKSSQSMPSSSTKLGSANVTSPTKLGSVNVPSTTKLGAANVPTSSMKADGLAFSMTKAGKSNVPSTPLKVGETSENKPTSLSSSESKGLPENAKKQRMPSFSAKLSAVGCKSSAEGREAPAQMAALLVSPTKEVVKPLGASNLTDSTRTETSESSQGSPTDEILALPFMLPSTINLQSTQSDLSGKESECNAARQTATQSSSSSKGMPDSQPKLLEHEHDCENSQHGKNSSAVNKSCAILEDEALCSEKLDTSRVTTTKTAAGYVSGAHVPWHAPPHELRNQFSLLSNVAPGGGYYVGHNPTPHHGPPSYYHYTPQYTQTIPPASELQHPPPWYSYHPPPHTTLPPPPYVRVEYGQSPTEKKVESDITEWACEEASSIRKDLVRPQKAELNEENPLDGVSILADRSEKNPAQTSEMCALPRHTLRNGIECDTAREATALQPPSSDGVMLTNNKRTEAQGSPFIENGPFPTAVGLADCRNEERISLGTQWFYIDLQCAVQGPFASNQMRQWSESGFFKDDLCISQNRDGPFSKLSSYFSDRTKAFAPDLGSSRASKTGSKPTSAQLAPTEKETEVQHSPSTEESDKNASLENKPCEVSENQVIDPGTPHATHRPIPAQLAPTEKETEAQHSPSTEERNKNASLENKPCDISENQVIDPGTPHATHNGKGVSEVVIWQCDFCRKARFGTYDKALEHERECKERSHDQGLQIK